MWRVVVKCPVSVHSRFWGVSHSSRETSSEGSAAHDFIQHFGSPIISQINVINVIISHCLKGKVVELSFINRKAERFCCGFCYNVNSGLRREFHNLDSTSSDVSAFERAFVSG